MENLKIINLLLCFAIFLSCQKEKEIDTDKPSIDLTIADGFPVNCDTLYFGESFDLKALFKDNVELGSTQAFSIDIHNNFRHHSHSTEVTECTLNPKKDENEYTNPFTFINSYDIPKGKKEYETDLSIFIPSDDGDGNFDEGDYHFFISLTDKEGWSAQKGLSIKMLHR
jgi:hypothetical protein